MKVRMTDTEMTILLTSTVNINI